MQALRVVAFCLIIATCSLAQNTTTSSHSNGITILELKWSRKTASPRLYLPSRREYENSGGLRQNPDAALHSSSPIPSSPFPYLEKLPYFYTYSLKVKNVGAKTVQGILWEYVTTDTVSGAELNRRPIINYQRIKSRRFATLLTTYASPPTNVVTPEALGENERAPFRERAEIVCVLYTDGMQWEAPEIQGTRCEELRQVDVKVKMQKKRHR